MLNRRSMLGVTLSSVLLPATARSSSLPSDRVRALYQQALVINGNLGSGLYDVDRLSPSELAEWRRSGLTAFKQSLGGEDDAKSETLRQIEGLERVVTAYPDLFLLVRHPKDVLAAKQDGRIGIIASFEGASMLEGKVDSIDCFRAHDVLVMGLSYNNQSPFGSGTLVRNPTGLTPLGREAVMRMNAIGVTLDVSHSDELTSLAAISVSVKPILVSHAGCAEVYRHPRNKSDVLIRALADRGGVIGIYELPYISAGPNQQTLDEYMAHMLHALNVAGEDHVSVGSDADPFRVAVSQASIQAWHDNTARRKALGVAAPGEERLPFVVELNRSDRMAVIAEALAQKGYGARAIEKVLGENLQRVFTETWTSPA